MRRSAAELRDLLAQYMRGKLLCADPPQSYRFCWHSTCLEYHCAQICWHSTCVEHHCAQIRRGVTGSADTVHAWNIAVCRSAAELRDLLAQYMRGTSLCADPPRSYGFCWHSTCVEHHCAQIRRGVAGSADTVYFYHKQCDVIVFFFGVLNRLACHQRIYQKMHQNRVDFLPLTGVSFVCQQPLRHCKRVHTKLINCVGDLVIQNLII